MCDLLKRVSYSTRKEGFFPIMGQWKIFSDEESRLGEMADYDENAKAKYVNYYKEKDKVYYDKGIELIERVLIKFNHIPKTDIEKDKLIIDMLYSLHRFGFTFDEYFLLNLQDLNFGGRSKFISDKVRYYLYNKMNLQSNHELFRNKELTYNRFKNFYNRKLISIKSDDDYQLFVDFLASTNSFIIKPIDSDCGKGAKIYRNLSLCENDLLDLFKDIRLQGNVVVEELIEQAKEMSILHPQSVNTVRIAVVKNKDGIHIFHPFLRMGRDESIVDNAGSGGIFSVIDAKTGICYTAGLDEIGNSYIVHPNSGIVIPGFKIPKWNEAIEIVKKASILTTNCYIAWDLAYTDNGWVIVEGNDCGQFIMQYADKTGCLEEMLDLVERL